MTRYILDARAKVTHPTGTTQILLSLEAQIGPLSGLPQLVDLFNHSMAHSYPFVIRWNSGELELYFHNLEIWDAGDYLDDFLLGYVDQKENIGIDSKVSILHYGIG